MTDEPGIRRGIDHLWAGWRSSYIESFGADGGAGGANAPRPVPQGDGSLFERILAQPDADAFVVHRGALCSALLNAYPYASGHVLVLPNVARAALTDLTDGEHIELWATVRATTKALQAAYSCDGINIGMNLGTAGGAGVPDHIHAHVLPRWMGDTNFMTSVADVRVLPEPLGITWRKLRDAWPAG